jgi:ketosteroid isomerase-like protein
MRALTCSVFAFFVAASLAYAQAPPADLQKAIDARAAAQRAGDEQGWGRYTTDDFMVVNPDGTVLTKADRMAQIKGNKAAGPPTEPTDRKVRVYGDTAIITTIQGANPTRFTTVWVKQAGAWKVASVHQTSITKK